MKAGGGNDNDYEDEAVERPVKKSNSLPVWGNEKTMNLNPLILTNIQSSQYFKVNLYQLKTYHEVIDEIYYKVNHLEPWEKGSRKTSGQTGMCGGVRGVGAGGIVSTAFCILYKLYTLKLTRKQLQALINNADSPYIRGLGFMYIRFTQPPADLWEWLESYLDDEEEIDVRAGGGQTSTIGTIVRHMLTKLEWHSTLFPRIPVPIQKDLEKKLNDKGPTKPAAQSTSDRFSSNRDCVDDSNRRKDEPNGEYKRNREFQERDERDNRRDREEKFRENREVRENRERDYREKEKHRDRQRERDRTPEKRERHRDHDRRSRDRDRERERRHHHHQSSRGHRDQRDRERSYSYEIEREKERIKRDKKKSRSRSRSKDRSRRHRDH